MGGVILPTQGSCEGRGDTLSTLNPAPMLVHHLSGVAPASVTPSPRTPVALASYQREGQVHYSGLRGPTSLPRLPRPQPCIPQLCPVRTPVLLHGPPWCSLTTDSPSSGPLHPLHLVQESSAPGSPRVVVLSATVKIAWYPPTLPISSLLYV